jgi:hypothetical protein
MFSTIKKKLTSEIQRKQQSGGLPPVRLDPCTHLKKGNVKNMRFSHTKHLTISQRVFWIYTRIVINIKQKIIDEEVKT